VLVQIRAESLAHSAYMCAGMCGYLWAYICARVVCSAIALHDLCRGYGVRAYVSVCLLRICVLAYL